MKIIKPEEEYEKLSKSELNPFQDICDNYIKELKERIEIVNNELAEIEFDFSMIQIENNALRIKIKNLEYKLKEKQNE